MLDPQRAIDILIQSDGNLNLAIDRSGCTKGEFLSAVADSSTLQVLFERMRALAILKMFDMFNMSFVTATAALSELEPTAAVKNFSTIASQLALLTHNKGTDNITNNINVADITLKMLPPEIREAVISLTSKEVKAIPDSDNVNS